MQAQLHLRGLSRLKEDLTLLVPNGLGVAVGALCITVFHLNAGKRKPWLVYATGTAMVMSASFLFLAHNHAAIGYLGSLLSVILSASPLAVVRTVIAEKSTDAMPFSISLMMWLGSLCWMLYGALVARDPLILYPNVLGFCLASTQLLLFLVYGAASKSTVPSNIIVSDHYRL